MQNNKEYQIKTLPIKIIIRVVSIRIDWRSYAATFITKATIIT